MRINERFSIVGAAGVLGLVFLLGLFGFLSMLGADPSKPLNSLRSEEEIVAREGPDEESTRETGVPVEGEPGPVRSEESEAADEPPTGTTPPSKTNPPAVLAAAAVPRETRPTGGAAGQPQPPPPSAATAAPTPPSTPPAAPDPTPAPTAPPPTPAPPDGCSAGSGVPLIRENGKHVRLEYATVASFAGDSLLVEAAGTVALLHLTSLTVITGNLSAATLVRAEGHRERDGTVTAELVEVLCPDSARG